MSDFGSSRHQSRERALEILYEAEMKDRPAPVVLASLPVAPDDYCVTLVRAADEHRQRAEDLIETWAHDWPLDRIAVIDRLILTMATAELLLDDGPPRAVVLDEAVELAKTYSTDGSGSFVNGLLTAIADDLGGEAAP
jgi:N utilization substance protein B